jgi:hypothetical protein
MLAAVAALLLVPAASAFAAEELHVTVVGSGAGEITSGDVFGEFKGTPTLACSYASPGPQTGVCDNEFANLGGGEEEVFAGFGGYATEMTASPAPGSEFIRWELVGQEYEGCGVGDPKCKPYVLIGEGEEASVTPCFVLTGQGAAGCTPPAGPELTVTKEGTGSGTVVSSPAGIECGGTCSAAFEENTKVTLTASPSAGSTFVSWKGCEKGGAIGRQCTVTMDKAKTVSAKFLLAYDVTVNRVGTGLGKVQSAPSGILCLANCSSTKAAFKEGTSVTLTATPSKNYVFTEWTGDCSGSGTCSLSTLSANKTVGAKFTPVAQHNLTLTKSGGGNGVVKAAQAGINCGATCLSQAAAYFQGTVVELTATPGKGSSFGGWSGACTGTGTCTVTMSEAKAVTAEFK